MRRPGKEKRARQRPELTGADAGKDGKIVPAPPSGIPNVNHRAGSRLSCEPLRRNAAASSEADLAAADTEETDAGEGEQEWGRGLVLRLEQLSSTE
jgi:hypothetical protein